MLSLLVWSLSRIAVCLLSSLGQIFCTVLLLSKAVDKIHYCIVNYKPIGPQRKIPNVENSLESDMVVSLLANSSALQLPRISQCPCKTNILSVRHFIETSATVAYRLEVYYTRIQCFDDSLLIGRGIFWGVSFVTIQTL